MPLLANTLVAALDGVLAVIIESKKTIAVASDKTPGHAVARRLVVGDGKAVSSARQLGVDYAAGRGLKTAVRRKRLSAVRGRLWRYRALRKATTKRNAARVFKAAGAASLTHAADVTRGAYGPPGCVPHRRGDSDLQQRERAQQDYRDGPGTCGGLRPSQP